MTALPSTALPDEVRALATDADHQLAAELAARSAELLRALRASGIDDPGELRKQGDLRSHELLVTELAARRPADASRTRPGWSASLIEQALHAELVPLGPVPAPPKEREVPSMLKNARLLMTGLTGQLAGSIAALLAPHNEIYGLARYGKPGSKEAVEALGITPVTCDYTSGDFTGVPNDFDYVFHAAADVFPADIETGIKQNAEGTGLLLNHLNRARAWIYVSTSGVYWDHPDPWYAYQETDRCGGSTRINTRFAYGTSKFAGEAVARSLSRIHGVPLTIARMNWSYGRASFGGAPTRVITRVAQGEPVPVNPDWEMVGCPIHEDDMADHLEPFFDGATVGGTVTNWGGDDAISVERYVPWVAGLLGTSYSFTGMTDIIAYPRNLDPAKRISLTGPCKVKWQDGFRRIIEERFPGRLATAAPGQPGAGQATAQRPEQPGTGPATQQRPEDAR